MPTLPPATGPEVQIIDIWIKTWLTQIPCFPQMKTEGRRTKKKTVVSCHSVCQNYTGASKCIVPLKFCLNMSSVRWQLNGRTKQDCLLCQDSEAPEAWHQPLWRLAQFWQSANIWQVFRKGVCIYLTLLVDRFFWLKKKTKKRL